jgi:hypothetical protein
LALVTPTRSIFLLRQYRLMGTWLIKFDATGATEQALSYNLNGDRLSKTVASQSTLNYGYQSRAHQLTLVGNLQKPGCRRD